MIKFPSRPVAWYCKLCKKFDYPEVDGAMAKPEHVPYMGVDIGTCKGIMLPLYSAQQILDANAEPLKFAFSSDNDPIRESR